MTAPQIPIPTRTMNILYAAIVGFHLTALAVLVGARLAQGIAAPDGGFVLVAVLGFVGTTGLGASVMARQRFPARVASETPDQFWSRPASRSAAVLIWILGEIPSIFGAVIFFLTGAAAVTAAMVGGALVVMALSTPARLANE